MLGQHPYNIRSLCACRKEGDEESTLMCGTAMAVPGGGFFFRYTTPLFIY
jgi:hypothetical protein